MTVQFFILNFKLAGSIHVMSTNIVHAPKLSLHQSLKGFDQNLKVKFISWSSLIVDVQIVHKQIKNTITSYVDNS